MNMFKLLEKIIPYKTKVVLMGIGTLGTTVFNSCKKEEPEGPKPPIIKHTTTYKFSFSSYADVESTAKTKASSDSIEVEEVVLEVTLEEWRGGSTHVIREKLLAPNFKVSNKVKGKGCFYRTTISSMNDYEQFLKWGYSFDEASLQEFFDKQAQLQK